MQLLAGRPRRSRRGRQTVLQSAVYRQALADDSGDDLVYPGGSVQNREIGTGDAFRRGLDQLREDIDEVIGCDPSLILSGQGVSPDVDRLGLGGGERPLGVRIGVGCGLCGRRVRARTTLKTPSPWGVDW